MATKTTKRALLVSVISLFVCFTMLIGTTYAWFTDSVTSAGNIIKTGTLDVSLEYSKELPTDKDSDKWIDASTGAIFNHGNWEPGYTEVRYVKIENEGTLALKFVLNIIPSEKTADNEPNLADVIDVYMLPVDTVIDRATLAAATPVGTLASLIAENDGAAHGELAKGECEMYVIVLKMQETAGNEYQNRTVGGTFAVQLLATQLASESDDLGTPDYDKDAEYPEVNMGVANKAENVETTVVANDADSNEQVVGVTVPANAPAGEYALEVTNVQTKTDDNGNTTLYMDINLKCDGVKVTADGNIVYTVSVDVGAGLNLTKVVHDGEEITEFEYNVATGIITFDTADFSPFAFTYDNGEAANDVASLAKLVAAGGIIQLSENVVLEDAPLVITKDTVLNLNGYTLSGTSTSSNASYLIEIKNGASLMIQNGTVSFYATTPDTNWGGEGKPAFPGYANNTVKAAGELIVNNATIKNITEAGGASYAIDCYPGADVVINDGSVIDGDDKIAIRMFANSDKDATNVTINGGTVTGHRAVWVQLPGNKFDNKMIANLTVNGGTLVATDKEYNLAIYSYSYGNSFANTNITLNGGVFNGDIALGGGDNKADTENFTAKWDNCEFNGAYGVYRYVANDGVVSYVFVSDEAELRAALAAGNVAVLKNDINVDADNTITVNNVAAIDLNGKTLAGVSDQTGANRNLFDVRGTLTVENGTVTVEHVGANMAWNNSTNVFNVTAGGVLNLVDVEAENLGGSDMAFVAHLNNWGEVTLNVENSVVKSTYCAIRVFNSGYDMNNVTIENSKIYTAGNRAFWVHNYSGDDKLLNFDIFGNNNEYVAETNTIGGPIRYGFDNPVYYNANGAIVTSDVKSVDALLLAGKDVALSGNMSINASDTTANSGYGATGVAVNGGVLDGNNYALGVNSWGTWDCAVNTTGGTIKNLKINSGMRGIFMGSATADVYVDNVVIDGTIYTFNSDGGNTNYGVYISNSTLNGWTSFSNVHKEVVFTDCNFGEGNGYAFCRPYNASVFENCVFEEGFEFDTTKTSGIVFINCYYGETLITAENAASLGIFYNGLNGAVIK